MTEQLMWIVGQTVILGILIGSTFVRTRERITKLETTCEHIMINTHNLKQDHKDLSKQVDEISRTVSVIKGKLSNSK